MWRPTTSSLTDLKNLPPSLIVDENQVVEAEGHHLHLVVAGSNCVGADVEGLLYRTSTTDNAVVPQEHHLVVWPEVLGERVPLVGINDDPVVGVVGHVADERGLLGQRQAGRTSCSRSQQCLVCEGGRCT